MGGGHEVDADVGGARRCVLLEVDELLRRRQAPAAVLDGPVQPGVAAVVEEALPAGVVGAAGVPVARWRRRTVGGDGVVEEGPDLLAEGLVGRSEEHTSELQSLMRISYAVFCLKKKRT